MIRRSTLAEHVLDDLDLVRHLGAAEDGDERSLRRFEDVAEILQLLLHQQAGRRAPDVVRDPFDRRVRAMRGAEGVVDVLVGERRERLGERRIVLLFLRMEPQVLEQYDAPARPCTCCHRARRVVAHAIVGERHGPSEQIGQPIGDRAKAHLRIDLALRPAQMAGEDDGGALLQARAGSSAAMLECECHEKCR